MRPTRWIIIGLGLLGVLAPFRPGNAQSAWSYGIRWEHDGSLVTHFRLCVDGACEPVSADRVSGTTWQAGLPLLAAGDHRLVVEACNATLCTPGRPDIFLRVQPVAVGPPVAPVPPPPVKPKDSRLMPRGTYPDPLR
jgi:hypothetical protein